MIFPSLLLTASKSVFHGGCLYTNLSQRIISWRAAKSKMVEKNMRKMIANKNDEAQYLENQYDEDKKTMTALLVK